MNAGVGVGADFGGWLNPISDLAQEVGDMQLTTGVSGNFLGVQDVEGGSIFGSTGDLAVAE